MAATATNAFRFMDLPQEVRDRIYETILCTWPLPRTIYDEMRQVAVVPSQMAYIHHKVDIGILLANHRIFREATDVLIKRNLFVRIVLRGLHVRSIMMPKQVPIVAEGAAVVDAFKGYVMSHSIEMPDTDIFAPHHIMILQRDLDLFCQALAVWGNAHLGARSKHCVTLHNPFANTSSPNYLSLKKQAGLLQPYRKHLRGFTSFEVVGNVDSSLAEAVAREMRQDSIRDPQELVREMLLAKQLGKEYFDEGDSNMASGTWSKASIKLLQLAGSALFTRMKAQSADGWSETLAELFFQLNSNLAANTLRVMRKELPRDPELAGQYAGSLYNAVQMASSASKMFDTNWQPTPQQEAKLCYRLSSAHRIARDDVGVAEHCINLAAQHFPNDSAIQQEKRIIAEWRARGGM
ncbi:hypothetical protein GGR50DRAFT_668059 [Xylaria sp. CBS 124048]|nr:hypothetical protein GGR50DRAFT_668059 [Xylaria sp. CBS 124048]